MPGSPREQPADDASVRHLFELGYADPTSIAAAEDAVRRQLEYELQWALQLRRKGQFQEATAALEKLSGEASEWPQPRQQLAELYYQLGQVDRAAEQVEWLTDHGIEHPRIAIIDGAIALMRRNIATAIEILEYACFVEPTIPSGYRLLGMAHLRHGNVDAAAECFERAIEQDAADSLALDGLSSVWLARGQFETAADFALQALEADMRLARAHYHLGVALACLGRHEEAIHALEASARAAPMSAAPYCRLSQLAEERLSDPALSQNYRQRGREIARERRRRSTAASAR